MCAADTTLEKSLVEDGEVRPDVDGWGVQHECRDWDAIHRWSVENRIDNATLIVPPFLGLYAGLHGDDEYEQGHI
jgi:Mycotoxin biosynthesis protein UstYa